MIVSSQKPDIISESREKEKILFELIRRNITKIYIIRVL